MPRGQLRHARTAPTRALFVSASLYQTRQRGCYRRVINAIVVSYRNDEACILAELIGFVSIRRYVLEMKDLIESYVNLQACRAFKCIPGFSSVSLLFHIAV